MGISTKQLKAIHTLLQGFGGGTIISEGVVNLSLALGLGQKQVTELTSFQIVRISITYNEILGRPLLSKIKAIISTFHLAMKFPTNGGVEVVRGDQTTARHCYMTNVRGINSNVMQMSSPDLEVRERLAHVEELLELEPGKKVKVDRNLNASLTTALVTILSRSIDVLEWKLEDMPGIDPMVAVHKLNVNPGANPVK